MQLFYPWLTGLVPEESGTRAVPAGSSEYQWGYINPYTTYYDFTASGDGYPNASLIQFVPYEEFGGYAWAEGFRPSLFGFNINLYSTTWSGTATLEVIDTAGNVIGSWSTALAAGESVTPNSMTRPLTFAGHDMHGIRIVLDSPAPAGDVTGRLEALWFEHDFEFERLTQTEHYWSSNPYDYSLSGQPASSYAYFNFESETTPQDGYITLKPAYRIAPVPPFLSLFWELLDPAAWESALDGMGASSYVWQVEVIDTSDVVIGSASIELDPAADYVANPLIRMDLALDSENPIDRIDGQGVGFNITGLSMGLANLQFSYTAPSSQGARSCYVKPIRVSDVSIAEPGQPGHPGLPARPGYWTQEPCRTVTTTTFIDGGGGGYESVESSQYTGELLPDGDDSLVEGFGSTSLTYPISAVESQSGGSVGGLNQTTKQVCYEPVWVPPFAGVPPTPALAPTETEYNLDYDIGWNYDVMIGVGGNIGIDISTAEVSRNTAGVLIGIAEAWRAGLSGPGKFHLALQFDANEVSVVKAGERVWGIAIRSESDVFSIRRYESQVIVLRNGAVIFSDDDFWSGDAVFVGMIWKAGDGICLPGSGLTEVIGAPIGEGSGEARLPALVGVGHEGAYGDGRATLPMLTLSADGYADGEADVTLPPLFGWASEGAGGYADARLPAFGIDAFAADAYQHFNGFARIELPAFGGAGYEAGYAVGDANLPAAVGAGNGGFTIPEAEGADVQVPSVLFMATGVGGEIGGADVALPAFDVLGSEGTYGEGEVALPALWGHGIEIPTYRGLLRGQLPSLDTHGWYAYTSAPNSLTGYLGRLAGSLRGGASLAGDLPALEGSLTADVPIVGRLAGTLARMTLESSVLVGSVAGISARLPALSGEFLGGARIAGELSPLSGGAAGAAGIVATLSGRFSPMTMTAAATAGIVGRLRGELPYLEAFWGHLAGELPGLAGRLGDTTLVVESDVAWAMNVANQAWTRYPGFHFAHLLRFRGQEYFARADGIYAVGGDLDAGAHIEARFALPDSTYGDIVEKVCPRAYLRGRSVGELAVTPVVDGQAHDSRLASESRGEIDYVRVKLGRGLRGHYWSFEVANQEGQGFEIDGFDMLLKSTGRRY